MTTDEWSTDYKNVLQISSRDYKDVSQWTKDQLLRTALWELVMGGPGDGAFWSKKIAVLLKAGAQLRPEGEPMSSPAQQSAAHIALVKLDPKPAEFNRAADAALDGVRAIYAERGGQYADTWALENIVDTHTRATLRGLGFSRRLTPEESRLVICAALIDAKDSRMGAGGWKADNVDDRIAYAAAYRTFREEYENGGARDSSTFS